MKTLFLCLLATLPLIAALPNDAVWQVQTGSSSDSNGGCWSTSNQGATGVDHSTGAGSTFTSTLSASGTGTLTDSGAGFLNTMLGNCINIAGQGTYNIQGFTNSTTVTVDRNLGTFSTTSGHEGGPLLSLGHVCNLITAGNVAFFKNDGTFTIASASANADAGTCTLAVSALIVGYTSNRTQYNTDSPPTIQTNVSTATMFGNSSGSLTVLNFILDGNTQTASKLTAGNVFIKVQLKNFNTASTGINAFYNASLTTSSAAIFSGSGSTGLRCIDCDATLNTATPFVFNGVSLCVRCFSHDNPGATTDGFFYTSYYNFSTGCTAIRNGRDGFRDITNGNNNYFINVYAESNVGIGLNISGTSTPKFLIGYGYYNNGTDVSLGTGVVRSTAITPSSTAFVSATNLQLNNVATGGALLRGAALPASFMLGLTANYLDMNAAQHQDTGGGSIVVGQ